VFDTDWFGLRDGSGFRCRFLEVEKEICLSHIDQWQQSCASNWFVLANVV
jgi:hypothetical protein